MVGAVALLGEGKRLLGELGGLPIVAGLIELEYLLIELEQVRLDVRLGRRRFPGFPALWSVRLTRVEARSRRSPAR